MRRLSAFLFASLIVFTSAQAFALDGYKDRHGLFLGVGLGGGPGAVHVDDELLTTGLDDGSELGFHLHAIAGGGINQRITLGAELNTWIRTVAIQDLRLNHQHWSLNAAADFFIIDGLFLGAGAGLAYAFSDATLPNLEKSRYQEMGLALKGAAGYEFFLNGTVAAGVRLSYTRHFYQHVDFDTFQGALTLRWY